MATQQEIATHLGVDQAVVSRLARKGVIPAAARGRFDLDACRLAYCAHLREQAAGRSSGDGDDAPKLVAERARLARAQAESQERKNLEADEQLIDMDEASELFFVVGRTARDAWMNWPSRIAPLAAAKLGIAIDPLLDVLNEHVHQQLVDLGEPEFQETWEERRR